MKKYIVLLFLLIPFIACSQGGYAKWSGVEDLFDSADITSGEVVLTNADTVDSDEMSYSNRVSGNIRVTVNFDTTSGTTIAYLDFKYKINDYGITADDWVTTNIDSFELADDNAMVTYQFSQSGYTFMDDPIIAYKISLRQVGTQVNRFKVSTIYYEP